MATKIIKKKSKRTIEMEKAAKKINKMKLKGVSAKVVDLPKGDGLTPQQRRDLKKFREEMRRLK